MLIIDAANSAPAKHIGCGSQWHAAALGPALPDCAAHRLQQCHFKPTAPEKNHCAVHIPLDFAAKASIAVGVDGLLLGRRPAWPPAPGLWWCKHRDRRGADLENEAMATRQTSKQAKTKAEAKVDPGATNEPVAKSEREPQRRNPRARSRSAGSERSSAEQRLRRHVSMAVRWFTTNRSRLGLAPNP